MAYLSRNYFFGKISENEMKGDTVLFFYHTFFRYITDYSNHKTDNDSRCRDDECTSSVSQCNV